MRGVEKVVQFNIQSYEEENVNKKMYYTVEICVKIDSSINEIIYIKSAIMLF